MMTKKQLKKIIFGLMEKDCDLCFNQHKDSCTNSAFCNMTECKPYFQPKHELYKEFSLTENIYSVVRYQNNVEVVAKRIAERAVWDSGNKAGNYIGREVEVDVGAKTEIGVLQYSSLHNGYWIEGADIFNSENTIITEQGIKGIRLIQK